MCALREVLTDVADDVWRFPFDLTGSRVPLNGATNWSVRGRRLRGGLSDGVDVIAIDNGALRLEILPTRGMGIWRGEYHGGSVGRSVPTGLPIGWDSPVKRPVHPSFVNQTERGGLGWLTGFNELLCRCGLSFLGPPGRDADFSEHPIAGELTLHGKIANIPAHFVEVTVDPDRDGQIAVTGIVEECSMFGPCLRLKSTLQTNAGSNCATVIDEVTNLSAKPAEFELLYHTNIGRPFLEAGSRLLTPTREMCPRDARAAEGLATFDQYEAPTAGYAEQAYLFQLAADEEQRTQVMLVNAAGDLGFGLKFSVAELPCFTVWKNTAAEADGYVTGLEPGTNFPNLRSFERVNGRLISLAPGQTRRQTLELAIHPDRTAVAAATAEIKAIQESVTPAISAGPLACFSSAG